MNKAKKSQNKKCIDKGVNNAKPIQASLPALVEQEQTLNIQQAINLAVKHHTAGDLPKAEGIYQQILQADPNQPLALNLLGVLAHQVGKNETAVDLITKAISIEFGYFESHSNLGLALHGLGQLDEAVSSYRNAIAIKPDHAEAHYNLGNTFQELGQIDEAVASYNEALSIKPGYAEAHSNLGNVYTNLGQIDEAVANFNKAIAIKPDYAEALYNLGVVLHEIGQLDEAVESLCKAIAIKPDYAEAHNNLKLAIKALTFSRPDWDHTGKTIVDGLNSDAHATINFALQQFYLDRFKPHAADKGFEQLITALPTIADATIPINEVGSQDMNAEKLPDKTVALLHLGRSGTGLLHSLIDGHPEITTLPSIYLRGYFNEGVWDTISVDGWRGLPTRFADEFAVLFDSRISRPIPSRLGELSISIGNQEGMTSVGEGRDQFLSLDKEAFCVAALSLMEGMESINPMSFLMVIHAAFEKVIGAHGHSSSNKRLCFYHIHNPDDYALANFLRYAPDARLLVTVREPIQNCESWLYNSVEKNNYDECVHHIFGILFGFDQVQFRMRDTVGMRLEDLKVRPEATMKALCAWLKVEDSPTLYEMTAQGQKWWGTPTDPGFNAKHADPFDQTSIKRPIGKILGERDQFVLGTLFYPFSVRFGYREPEPEQFQKDLKEIRPMIIEMLDFEKTMAKRLNIDHEQFKRRGSYQLLRAGLIDRWNVLDELGDYPHMLAPLSI